MQLRATLLAAAFACGLAAPAAASTPSQLVIFGDSLVDAGNIFLLTGGYAPTNTFNNRHGAISRAASPTGPTIPTCSVSSCTGR